MAARAAPPVSKESGDFEPGTAACGHAALRPIRAEGNAPMAGKPLNHSKDQMRGYRNASRTFSPFRYIGAIASPQRPLPERLQKTHLPTGKSIQQMYLYYFNRFILFRITAEGNRNPAAFVVISAAVAGIPEKKRDRADAAARNDAAG